MTMYAYTITSLSLDACTPTFKVVCISENIEALRKCLREDVKKYIDNVYDEESLKEYGLTPLNKVKDFWSDEVTAEDFASFNEFRIIKVPIV